MIFVLMGLCGPTSEARRCTTRPTLEERDKIIVAVPQWNILPGERATVALTPDRSRAGCRWTAPGDLGWGLPLPNRSGPLWLFMGWKESSSRSNGNQMRAEPDLTQPVINVFIVGIKRTLINNGITPFSSYARGLRPCRIIIQKEKY
jgi:hypothetical protein